MNTVRMSLWSRADIDLLNLLHWPKHIQDDVLVGFAKTADNGMMRFIALAILLLQPQAMLPEVIVIDEPELGLHPAGLNLLGGML